MRTKLAICFMILSTMASIRTAQADTQPLPYPATRIENAVDTFFGTEVRNPYRWLENGNDAEVQSWITAQDQLTRDQLKNLPGREQLLQRFKDLFYVESLSTPVVRGTRLFYTRVHADKDKAVLYWRENADAEERLLLDPNSDDFGKNNTLGSWTPSPDGKTLAYTFHPNNADEALLRVMNVDSGQLLAGDTIQGAKYAEPEWTPAGDGFYYTFLPSDPSIPVADRPGYAEVRFHALGTAPAADPLVHPRTGDAGTFIAPSLSHDGRWLFVFIQHGWNGVEIYLRDLWATGTTDWKPLFKSDDTTASIFPWQDDFYILTNDGAPRYQLLKTSAAQPDQAHWQPLVPESADAVIESAQVIGGRLVLSYLHNASNRFEVRQLDGTLVRELPLPTLGSSGGVSGDPEQDGAYFSFTSYTFPTRIYRTSLATGDTGVWAQVQVPVDPSPYLVEQAWYPSKDGTKISMFIVRRKDMVKDGSTPLVLYGYGGFNVNMLPAFSSSIYPWLEAGGAYAVPNLRGGGEYGEDWHRAGMLTRKQNVFDDFAAAAEYLIREGYTKSERLAISGGSNGGLLVGAALTQRPELFRAVLCGVPLLDMIRYEKFGSGATWAPEYGSVENEEQFRALLAYSPYHHVKPGVAYPSVLFQSSDFDDRVDPMHARKMAAALQAANPAGNPILLRIERNSGHGGAGLISSAVEKSADSWAFVMRELGVRPPARR